MVDDPKTERDALRNTAVQASKNPRAAADCPWRRGHHRGRGSRRRLASALKKQGTRVELLIEKEEGHGFKKEENRFKLYRAMERFLKENL